MLSLLAAADGLTWITIVTKAATYAAALWAAGSVLACAALRTLSASGKRAAIRLAAVAALMTLLLSLAELPLRAGFLAGGTLAGVVDPMLVGMVAGSPLGTSVFIRAAGALLILALLLRARAGQWVAVAGAVLICTSFAFRGHALEEPRVLLGMLVTAHILGLAFWIGGLAPLSRATRIDPAPQAARLAQDFGRKALWVVAALVAAGGILLAVFGLLTPAAILTPYGQAFAAKLALVAGAFAFAATNKIYLTPALLSGAARAGARLRWSIRLETALICCVLLVTAVGTSLAGP